MMTTREDKQGGHKWQMKEEEQGMNKVREREEVKVDLALMDECVFR